MPFAPLQRCSWPGGCHVLVKSGRCEAHRAPRSTPLAKTTARGYGADHQAIPLGDCCEECGTSFDLQRSHIVAIEDGGTNDPENYRTLCRTDNNRQAAADTKARRQR